MSSSESTLLAKNTSYAGQNDEDLTRDHTSRTLQGSCSLAELGDVGKLLVEAKGQRMLCTGTGRRLSASHRQC